MQVINLKLESNMKEEMLEAMAVVTIKASKATNKCNLFCIPFIISN